jgi:glutathione S-transferase
VRLYDYTASANCYKPRLLLALLDRDYERVAVDIFAGDTLTDTYAMLNPARETPVLELDDGTLLTQSNAILWFLAEGTAFLPQSPLERGQVVQWLFFEQERVMSGIGGGRFRIATGRDPQVIPAHWSLGKVRSRCSKRTSRSAPISSAIPVRSPTWRTSPTHTSPKTPATTSPPTRQSAPGSNVYAPSRASSTT